MATCEILQEPRMSPKKSGSPKQESGFCLGGRGAEPGECPSELGEFWRGSGISPTLVFDKLYLLTWKEGESCHKEGNLANFEDCQLCFTSSGIFQECIWFYPHCHSKKSTEEISPYQPLF